MKSNLLLAFLFLGIYSFAQDFNQLRYTNTLFDQVDTLKDVEYATAPFLDNLITDIPQLTQFNIHEGEETTTEQALHMDIYMPQNDTINDRPAVVFVHGGGFLIGSKHNEDMVALCDSFARMGYVTASIQYRLGVGATVTRVFEQIVNINVDVNNFSRSVYRGIQDGRAAVRFLKTNAATYGIDSSMVYMAGSSAGAFVTIHNVYMDKVEEIPAAALAEPSLGGLDDIGVEGSLAKVDAIAPFWGAIQSTDLIEEDQTPALLIHGTADEVVVFKEGKPLQSLVPPNPLVTFDVPVTYGSYCIDSTLNTFEVESEHYFVDGANHEFYGVSNGEFPPDGPNNYWDSVYNKVNMFFNKQHKPIADFEYDLNDLLVSFYPNSIETVEYIQWDFGDGTYSNVFNAEHEYVKPGIYTVELSVQNGHYAWDKQVTTIQVGEINEAFTISFLVNLNNMPVSNAQVTLDDFGTQLTDENGVTVFEDVTNDQPIPFSIENFSGDHMYYDTIYTLSSDTLIAINFDETNIEKQSAIVNLYPNPNNGLFYLQLSEATYVQFYNASGQLIYFESKNPGVNVVDLSTFSDGVYYLKAISGNAVENHKIIIN